MSTTILILFFLTCLVTWFFTARALSANIRDVWAWVLAVGITIYTIYATRTGSSVWPLVGAILGIAAGIFVGLLSQADRTGATQHEEDEWA